MADNSELELGDWEPHDVDEFPPAKRPTIELLNAFGEAFHDGRVPTHCWRSTGPDYDAQQVVITIFPDDLGFRDAVAAVLPVGTYRIEVDDIQFLG